MRIFGGTRRAKSPKLRAILVARDGDANIGRAAVTLPKALILEQSSLANVCTRVQFAAHDCPKDSIYGYAQAETPLLDGPLKGPVYLRSSDNELPDMVAALNGQVDIELARAHRQRQRPAAHHLRHRPRRAGLEVHAHRARRQETRPAGQHAQPLRAQAQGDRPLQSPERQEGEQAAEAAHPLQEEGQGGKGKGGRR